MSAPSRQTPSDQSGGDFYVHYLPATARAKRLARIAIPATLWLLVVVALLRGWNRPDPGSGVWDDATPRTFTGLVQLHPYPMLIVADPNQSGEAGTTAYLIVEMGKHGSQARIATLDGRIATLSGWLLQRSGRVMIELEPGDSAIKAATDAASAPIQPVAAPVGTVELAGEIVDSKCFLGAMKPGEGKTHKACATLCINGGIPPVLVTRDHLGREDTYLLQSPGGAGIDPAIHPLIADHVRVTGELHLQHGLKRLAVTAADVTRIADRADTTRSRNSTAP
jgi:hypothetical protein